MEPYVRVEWPDYDSNSLAWNAVPRFPSEAVGFREWMSLNPEDFRSGGLDWLSRLQALSSPPTLCPRIFISHRQSDRLAALKTARIVSQCGFDFWLDILDPRLLHLSGLPASVPVGVAMAAVIEMALLNCTHVIALRTLQSKGSAWIPYEFGRVKAKTFRSDQAGSWVDPAVPGMDIEEYFHLGIIRRDKLGIQQWLNAEFAKTTRCPRRLPVAWADPDITDDLP
jgi:hypothetical protein